jgi:hypothetical protein
MSARPGKRNRAHREVRPFTFRVSYSGVVVIGAGEGIRTLDPDLGKVVLYP